ncbi:MAG: GIY-YIG nuclease family protein [Pseudonocardiaceae bacterium]
MEATSETVDEVIAALQTPLRTIDDAVALLPQAKGLYAWWAPTNVLPHLPGPPFPTDTFIRLLYVGLATNLRTRITHSHLRRSGSSTLRRTLAGLLLKEHGLRTRWIDRVVLIDDDELRLTGWMHQQLLLSWCQHSKPRQVEADVITRLRPPLNVVHTSGPLREIIRDARARFQDSAGPRPKDIGR